MIEERATVIEWAAGFVWVETSRRSACSSCGEGAGCGAAMLSGLFAPGTNRLVVEDNLGVGVGERIVIGIPDGLLIRASLVAYLLPLTALIASAGFAQWLHAAEAAVALAGIAGLGGGIWLTGRLSGGSEGRRRYRPVLLRREPPTVSIPVDFPAAPRPGH